MSPAMARFDECGAGGGTSRGPVGADEGKAELHDEECLRMAAFRIRETAKRIAVLADRIQDPARRRDLRALHERLLNEERGLLSTSAEMASPETRR